MLLVFVGGAVGEGSEIESVAEEWPEHREIRDVHCGRGLANIPQHVDGGVGIREVVDFIEDCRKNLDKRKVNVYWPPYLR